jgi:hypothetical protein
MIKPKKKRPADENQKAHSVVGDAIKAAEKRITAPKPRRKVKTAS